ncbi:MAG: FlgO family outer membrane protein [Candidatus Eremiobacterota bacterium]
MNKFFRIAVLFFIFAANMKAEPLNYLVNDLSKQINSTQTIRIAVLSFPYVDGFESMGSKIVQERLVTILSANKKFSVLERGLLHKVLEEKKLEMSGLVNDAETKDLGHMLGVEAVLVGSLLDINEKETEVNGRIIDVITGKIIASGKGTVIRTWQDKISIPKPIFEPTRVPKVEEVNIPSADFKIEADIETLEKYDEVFVFDRSEAPPMDKAKKWKEFSYLYPKYKDLAAKRAKEWEDYDLEFKRTEEIRVKRLETMKKDYQTLRRYLALTVISPEQKSEWAEKFMVNYGYGKDNIYRDEISKYLLPKRMTWYEAKEYCEKNGGRLPKISELKQKYENECSGDKYEANRCNAYYWSSEELPPHPASAVYIYLRSGTEGYTSKDKKGNIFCIK